MWSGIVRQGVNGCAGQRTKRQEPRVVNIQNFGEVSSLSECQIQIERRLKNEMRLVDIPASAHLLIHSSFCLILLKIKKGI